MNYRDIAKELVDTYQLNIKVQYLSPEDNWRKSNLYNPLIH